MLLCVWDQPRTWDVRSAYTTPHSCEFPLPGHQCHCSHSFMGTRKETHLYLGTSLGHTENHTHRHNPNQLSSWANLQWSRRHGGLLKIIRECLFPYLRAAGELVRIAGPYSSTGELVRIAPAVIFLASRPVARIFRTYQFFEKNTVGLLPPPLPIRIF